jgi:hypothetical protein
MADTSERTLRIKYSATGHCAVTHPAAPLMQIGGRSVPTMDGQGWPRETSSRPSSNTAEIYRI